MPWRWTREGDVFHPLVRGARLWSYRWQQTHRPWPEEIQPPAQAVGFSGELSTQPGPCGLRGPPAADQRGFSGRVTHTGLSLWKEPHSTPSPSQPTEGRVSWARLLQVLPHSGVGRGEEDPGGPLTAELPGAGKPGPGPAGGPGGRWGQAVAKEAGSAGCFSPSPGLLIFVGSSQLETQKDEREIKNHAAQNRQPRVPGSTPSQWSPHWHNRKVTCF